MPQRSRKSKLAAFEPLLAKLADDPFSVTPVTGWVDYCKTQLDHRLSAPPHLSPQSYSDLAPELREASTMVFRLGDVPEGRGTGFVLMRVPDRLSDFFLFDSEVFTEGDARPVRVDGAEDALATYRLLPNLSEGTTVNLALATGALHEALGLDPPHVPFAPAGVRRRFDFSFRPHHESETMLWHRSGQVEIDAMFVGRRQGRPHLFVIEAKAGSSAGSLAKHKLAYPIYGLAPSLPADLPIVPVYLRAESRSGDVQYDLVECRFPGPGSEAAPAVSQLEPVGHERFVIPLKPLSGR